MRAAGSRDPEVFARPDTVFDPDRADLDATHNFGLGPHTCLGAHLARLEAEVVVPDDPPPLPRHAPRRPARVHPAPVLPRHAPPARAETRAEELKRYVAFSAEDAALLRGFHGVAAPHFERIAQEFYDRIRQHEEAHAVFTGEDQIARLQRSLVKWMDRLFGGDYDEAYFATIEQIGRVHVKVGLPQRYMFAAMALIRSSLTQLAERQPSDGRASPPPSRRCWTSCWRSCSRATATTSSPGSSTSSAANDGRWTPRSCAPSTATSTPSSSPTS
jgi:truncated hemoglobin YjbI